MSDQTGPPGFKAPKSSPPPPPPPSPPESPPAAPSEPQGPPADRPRGLRGRLEDRLGDLRARGREQRPLGSPEGAARPDRWKRTTRSSPASSDERRLAVDGLAVVLHGASGVLHMVVRKLTGTARDLTLTAHEAFELAAPLASALEDRVEGSAVAMIVLDRAPELGVGARLVAYGVRVAFGLAGGATERQRHQQAVAARLAEADAQQRMAAGGDAAVAMAPERGYGSLVE